ncbi:MAG: LysR family transcriptional regulator [Alphaproteobacteria bacterium]|nr:LysR family transcriptional regulator [Alphaproteobacteria bacterium]
MDRIEAMGLFVAIVDAGSLAGAARRLHLPVQTVSRRLGALEGHLGARLLTRTTRRMALTEEGREYAEACRRVLADVEEAERRVAGRHGEPKGVLAVTAPVVFGRLHVLPAVLDFLETYREVETRMVLLDRVIDLVEEGIDAAIRIGPLPDSSLVATRLGELRRVVCASPAYIEKRGAPISLTDLGGHDCITFAGLTSPARWSFGEAGSIAVRSRLVVTTAEAAVDAAVAGLGVTRLLSYQVEAALVAGQLRLLLDRVEPPSVPVQLVSVEGRHAPARVRAFLDFAAPRIRARLAALSANPVFA